MSCFFEVRFYKRAVAGKPALEMILNEDGPPPALTSKSIISVIYDL